MLGIEIGIQLADIPLTYILLTGTPRDTLFAAAGTLKDRTIRAAILIDTTRTGTRTLGIQSGSTGTLLHLVVVVTLTCMTNIRRPDLLTLVSMFFCTIKLFTLSSYHL